MKIKLLLNSMITPTLVVDVQEDLGVTPKKFVMMSGQEKVELIMTWADKQGKTDIHDVLGYTEIDENEY